MIERLISPERPYGEPKYSKLSEKISYLRDSLYGQLNQEGQKWLEQLADAYMQQETAVLRDAFAEGFWTALKLTEEFEQWKHDSR